MVPGGLVKVPHLRQYFRGNVLVRENVEHKTSYLELFYDLIFVVSISQIGDILHHEYVYIQQVMMEKVEKNEGANMLFIRNGVNVGVFCVLFMAVSKYLKYFC